MCDSFDYALLNPKRLSLMDFLLEWESQLLDLIEQRHPHSTAQVRVMEPNWLEATIQLRSGMKGSIKAGAYLKCLNK